MPVKQICRHHQLYKDATRCFISFIPQQTFNVIHKTCSVAVITSCSSYKQTFPQQLLFFLSSEVRKLFFIIIEIYRKNLLSVTNYCSGVSQMRLEMDANEV